MDRRRFFKLFGMGVAGIALEQAIPLNRVWSFPSEIVIAPSVLPCEFLATEWITMETLSILREHLHFIKIGQDKFDEQFVRAVIDRDLLRIPTFALDIPQAV